MHRLQELVRLHRMGTGARAVDRLLKDVVDRACAINEDDGYAYRVARIALFGSALGKNPRPSDVDRAVTLSRRRRFPNITAEVFWPQTEVLLALRRRSRGLSLSEGDTPTRLRAESKIIFENTTDRRRNKR